jgi:phenylacetate-CoA ligase
VVEEEILLEIVRPGTGDPVADGEVGEVVVTGFNADYPLVRFATGDLSAVLPGVSPCGRTNVRIKGWLGRADQTTKSQGHVRTSLRRLPQFSLDIRALTVCAWWSTTRAVSDRMSLHCEVANPSDQLAAALGEQPP